jgi:hypothetical protein
MAAGVAFYAEKFDGILTVKALTHYGNLEALR